ncbi:glycerol kinase GlpK [Humibacter sp. BT305]|uniref:FGGY family carbohydrate kinase n=1 Tax=Cnuibacter physcomitrellae TaxID=1619308 RepID=UPI000E0C8B36|nr:glycerol kinase GlpK [Cnuibacter physcomitrellae]AXH35611.1 glycerol kinase GlpK [Humibacter sp. BT305]MCS5496505.1 glycerol kinase GlpK [Cnuibacter physcomitrellae]
MVKYILGIDEGTTSARAFVIDEDTNVRGFGQAELTQIYPRPGWIEHDPMQILNVQLEVIRAALRDAGITPDQLSGAGLTNQRETGIVWEKDTGRPIFNAVVWASRHSVDIVQGWVDAGLGDLIQQRTGLIPDAYYTASKIRWILDQVPGAQGRAERGELLAGTVDTWLIWNLTGRKSFVTDYSNASRTMMMNLETLQWDDELLGHYGIPKSMLAEIVPSDSNFGDMEATFGTSIPIGSDLGDQQAGLFGQAAFKQGQVKMTYGTAGVLNINCGSTPQRIEGLTPSLAWGVQGQTAYEIEGVLFSMGKTMQWLRDDLQLIHAAPDSEWYAGQVSSTEGVYLIPAFTGLAAPTWDPYARAALIGMSNATNRLHVIRAAVESMVYQTRDVVEAALAGSDLTIPELRVDGGAVKNNLLCQLQADLLGIPVIRPKNAEATIFGAMLMAGLSTGVYSSLEELESKWAVDRVFEPQMSRDQADSLYAGWTAARELTKGWTKKVPLS